MNRTINNHTVAEQKNVNLRETIIVLNLTTQNGSIEDYKV